MYENGKAMEASVLSKYNYTHSPLGRILGDQISEMATGREQQTPFCLSRELHCISLASQAAEA